MSEFKLDAKLRTEVGSGSSRKLRAEHIVPAQLYQREQENLNLQVVEKDLDKVVNEAGTSAIISLVVDGEEKNVIIRDYQKHPFKNQYLHVDFLGINMDEEIRVTVPIVLLNRDDINVQPSVLIQQLDEIEVETLPKYIPSEVTLDVKEMEYDDAFFVKDLDIVQDDNITILSELEETICVLVEPQEEELEDEVEEKDAADVEVIGEEDDEEQAEDEEESNDEE